MNTAQGNPASQGIDAPRTESALREALAAVGGEEHAREIIDELHRRAGQETALDVARRSSGAEADPAHAAANFANAELPQEVIAAAATQLASAEPLEGSDLDERVLSVINRTVAGSHPPGVSAKPRSIELFHTEAGLPPGVLPLAKAMAARAARHPLQRALLRRMGLLQTIDAALFLEINHLPHPRWCNVAMRGLTIAMKRADAVAFGLLLAGLRNPERGSVALAQALPALWITTGIIEVPVKRFFRRRRPFIDVVRAIVVGRRPGSYSFPSGHSAAAFAAATLLRRHYPRWTSAFYLLAVMVGFSRVYLGAHYPGDVAVGAVSGTLVAEVTRVVIQRPANRLVAPILTVLRIIRWLARN